MLCKPLLFTLVACSALTAFAQTQRSASPHPPPHPLPRYQQIDQLSVRSRTGDPQSTRLLTHMVLENASVPDQVADAMGYTDRVTRAEGDYRSGAHSPVHEIDIVRAVNHLMEGVAAPQWARTNLTEVRKLRMHLLIGYPHFIASIQPPDSKGNRKPLAETMSPLEATFIATTLVFQKANNPDYMFTPQELASQAPADSANRKTEQPQRHAILTQTFYGRNPNVSFHNLIQATDLFFTDLGIPPAQSQASAASPSAPNTIPGGAR